MHLHGGALMAQIEVASKDMLVNVTVKKSNDMVRARLHGVQDKTAARILACMIAQIKTDDTDLCNKRYTVQLSDYLAIDGKTKSEINLRFAKAACKSLVSTFAEIPTDNKGNFKEVPFFSEIEYKDGIVNAIFNQRAESYLTALQGLFTEYSVIEYVKLPSLYSQRVFEILKSYEKGLVKDSIEIRIEDFKKMLDCPPSMNDFRNLKRLVLHKSHKDINELTSLKYNWEPVKTGRKFTAIRFTIKKEKEENPRPEPKRKTSKKDLPLLLSAAPEPVEQDNEKIKNHALAIRDMIRASKGPQVRLDGLQSAGEILASALD